jgi:hypothetical protein
MAENDNLDADKESHPGLLALTEWHTAGSCWPKTHTAHGK